MERQGDAFCVRSRLYFAALCILPCAFCRKILQQKPQSSQSQTQSYAKESSPTKCLQTFAFCFQCLPDGRDCLTDFGARASFVGPAAFKVFCQARVIASPSLSSS